MTERRMELLALLPTGVQKSKELTMSAKLMLANIIQWHGTDYAKENKSCYRTNKEMMEDTGIKSENSIISGAVLLQQKGLISRTSGERGKASTYILNAEALETFTSRLQNTNCSNNANDSEVARLMATVGEMKSEISSLKSTIEELKAAISLITSNQNCSTDIETEKEIEKDITVITYEGNSNDVSSDGEDDIAVNPAEYNAISDDVLDSCPIDDWGENTDIEVLAELYGNNTVSNNTSNFKKWNMEITEAFNKLDADITLLYRSKSESESIRLDTKIGETFKWCNDNRGKFTDKQFKKVQVQCRRWTSIVDAKARYFKKNKNKTTPQTVQKCSGSLISPPLEQYQDNAENIKQPPAPIPDNAAVANAASEGAEWMDEFWKGVENSTGKLAIDEFPLNETTLRFEDMTDEMRKYFMASPFELKAESEPTRYIKAYKWLRNPMDADRLFDTFHEIVIAIVGGDIEAQNQYINRWNKHCEQVA